MAVIDSPGPGRVLIATSAGPLVAEPSWTRFDNLSNCRNFGYTCYAGRQSELDTTDTGSASVDFHDWSGVLDDDDLVGCQIMLQVYNPVTATWHIRWRGHIDDIAHGLVDVPTMEAAANVTMSCVGIFDYLGGCKMIPFGSPGGFGDAGGPATVAFYENETVQDRIEALLDNAEIAPTMSVVFTGNVDVNETQYDPDDVVLQACRDAADAEFPGVANFYEDRYGRCVFHGRFARFDPETVESSASNWDFIRWQAGTREDVTGRAQVREFSYNRPRARIINSYVAWPRADENGYEFPRSKIEDQMYTDPTSITAYGLRGREAPDLIIQKNFNNSNPGSLECELFSEFYIENYSEIRKAVQTISFSSLPPADVRAAATWDLMTRCDISDAIHLFIDEAGLSDESFFIDGIAVECRPLSPLYDHVTVTPNLTPASYYETDVFNP